MEDIELDNWAWSSSNRSELKWEFGGELLSQDEFPKNLHLPHKNILVLQEHMKQLS